MLVPLITTWHILGTTVAEPTNGQDDAGTVSASYEILHG